MDTQTPQNPILEPAQPVSQTPIKTNNSLVIILSVLLLIVVSIAGFFYFQTQKLSKKIANLQIQVQPTPLVSPEPSAETETADWKTYTNTKYGFSFKYPNSWKVKPCTDVLCGTLIEINSEVIKLEGFSNDCEVTSTPSQANAEKAAECNCLADGPGIHISCDTPSEEKTITNISGVSSYKFLLNELKNNNFQRKRGPFATIFFPKPIFNRGLLYEYGLYFEVLDTNKISIFDQILSTFKFLDQNSQTSSCTPKFKVESGPELTASEAYSQKCYEVKTKEECEKVDIYRESTQNFGNSDGIPDCNWAGLQKLNLIIFSRYSLLNSFNNVLLSQSEFLF